MPRSSTTQRPPARPSQSTALQRTEAGLQSREQQVNHPLVKYIAEAMPRIKKLLPSAVNEERFGALVLQSLIANPDILQCTPESVIQAVLEAAQDGLEPTGARGGAWLVKFGNEAQLIRDYRGVIRLIVGSGSATRVDAQEVRKGEAFSFQPAMPDPIHHEIPAVRETDVLGAYALFWLPDGSKKAEYMTAAEIEKVRQGSKAPNSLMWKDYWGQGARKTVIKRGANYLDLRPEIRAKLVTEDEAEFGGSVTVSPVAPDLAERRAAIAERTARLTGGNESSSGNGSDSTGHAASTDGRPGQGERAQELETPSPATTPAPAADMSLEDAQKAAYAAAKEAGLLEPLPGKEGEAEYEAVRGANWETLDGLARLAIPDTQPEALEPADWLFVKGQIEAGEYADAAQGK